MKVADRCLLLWFAASSANLASAIGHGEQFVPDRQLDAKLFEEAKAIPDDGGFDDFAVADLIDGDAAEGDFPVCRRHTEKFTAMRSRDGPVDDQLVLLRDGVVNFKVQVGQS